jgi:putative nucleotidyltransferase with HDIG domain
MKKKIDVQDLHPGMYVSELDRPWRETPFLFQGFEIRSQEEIDQLKRFCKQVYIDIELGHDLRPKPVARGTLFSPVAPAAHAESETIPFTVLEKFAAGKPHIPHYPDRTTLEEEIEEARDIERGTRALIYTIMEDARLGRSVDTHTAKQVVADMVESILRNPDALVCLNQLKAKHEYTALHSMRVCVLALAFGRHLEFTPEELQVLGMGALLHDVGKMKVPNEILNKPGRLTAEEFTLMKSHVPEGVAILEQNSGIPPMAIDVARFHHERNDGSGYSSGRQGDQIGLFGSIGAIVDCYDAITSDRVYHNGLSAFDALNMMYQWRRKDFHSELIEQYIQCMGIYPIGSVVELNTGSVGVVISVNRERRLKPRIALVLTAERKPYTEAKIVDLMHQPMEGASGELEIRKVLAAGAFGIDPINYLPIELRAAG